MLPDGPFVWTVCVAITWVPTSQVSVTFSRPDEKYS